MKAPKFGSTLAEVYKLAAEQFGDRPAFSRKDAKGVFQPTGFRELYEKGLDLAAALVALGVQARDHVGLISDNRLEWIVSDYGILLAGAADVPRGCDVTDGELVYILDHSDAVAVFVETPAIMERVLAQRGRLPKLREVVLMSPADQVPEGVKRLGDLLEDGARRRAAGDRGAEDRAAGVLPEDLCTIIYTSGTTGTPKGVQLTHANMCSQLRNLPLDLRAGDRALSILPVWHSYERGFEMLCISHGVGTSYTSLRAIGEDLKTVKPTVMASAPRLWENLYLKILANVNSAPPVRRNLFHLAYRATRHVKRARAFFRGELLDTEGRGFFENAALALRSAGAWLVWALPARLLDGLVLKKIRAVVGGEFRGTISGGGALQPHVDEFFNFIGIPVLEGYGMTETSPVLAVRTWDNLVIGTVGRMFPETEVRIVDLQSGAVLFPDAGGGDGGRGLRGEIHVRGPQVMRGYYKDPEGTARVLRDGWMNTGDIGMVTFNGCLKILGRSKETIVLLNGENVEPVPIEAKLAQSEFIDQVVVVGQDKKALGALVVPAPEAFRKAGVEAAGLGDFAASEKARELVDAEVRRLVCAETGFKAFERIAAWRFVPKAFEVGDEMTNTFKLKRHVIAEKYAALIDGMLG